MIKAFHLLRRSSDVGWYEFRSFVRNELVDNVVSGDGGELIDRVVTNYVLEHDFRPTTNRSGHRWHAVGEYYFADEERASRFLEKAQRGDRPWHRREIVDESSFTLVDEQLIYDRGVEPGMPKIFGIFKNSLPAGQPMSRQETLRQWKQHQRRMDDKGLGDLIEKFTRNIALPDHHAADARFDYDGASIVWCLSVEMAERLYKDEAIEQAVVPSGAAMGNEAADCVYLRTDWVEGFNRA